MTHQSIINKRQTYLIFHYFESWQRSSPSDENLKTVQMEGPMTRSRTKQLEDIFQQMVSAIFDKAQVEKDKGPEALPRILIIT